jgi:hypothetical protein
MSSKSDQEVVLEMVKEWEGSLESLMPTIIPDGIPVNTFLPRCRSMSVPRPSPRVPSLIKETYGTVRKLFDTSPPPINYDDRVVDSWTK